MAVLNEISPCHSDNGGNPVWIVQKFGGTSVGKYPLNIVQNVVRPATHNARVVVVSSARSNSIKSEGTTNRLLQAYIHQLKNDPSRSKMLLQIIRAEHINAAHGYIKNPRVATQLVQEIEEECMQALSLLNAVQNSGHDTAHTKDKIISTGERLACRFLCAVLRDQGLSCELIDFSNIVPTKACYTTNQSLYDDISTAMAQRVACCKAKIPVVTGFFGPVKGGLLAKVGRGYTDLCASLLSIGLRAHELQVWKEVDGIFTADPRKVPGAYMLSSITSEEASELTFHGSEVIHFTAMRLAMRAKIPMRIKNVMNPQDSGTLVHEDSKSVKDVALAPPAIAITSKDNIMLINIRSAERLNPHSFFAGIFSVLDRWNLSIDLIGTSEVQVSMALHSEVVLTSGDVEDDFESVRKDLKNAIKQLQEYGQVEIQPSMAVVSVVGKRMKRASGVAGRIFSVLGENNINIEMITQGASEISISCVIEERDVERAVALLHADLFAALPM